MAKRPLARILRVRDVQLTRARADEAAAHAQLAGETQLRERVTQLVAAVSPAIAETPAASLKAAAHYRERLTHTARAVDDRVARARAQAEEAAEATREAKRDQSAVEKLIARRAAEKLRAELRALEDAPAPRRRHGSC